MKERTLVLTLGRLPVALDLARSFALAGWRVVVAEPFRMHLCRMSRSVHASHIVTSPLDSPGRYLEDIARVVVLEQAELVVPVSEETQRLSAIGDRVGTARVFAAEAALLHEVHDKFTFTSLARRLGLDAPRSFLPGEFDSDQIANLDRVVIKPRHSSSGRGVRVENAADFEVEAGCLVQQFIEGDEVSGFGIARDGELLAPVVYRGTVFSGSVAVCFERLEPDHAAVSWMRDFVRKTGYSGFIAFDFIVDPSGRCWAIECNPRATSGIHFVASDALAALIVGGNGRPPQSPYRKDRLLTESWSCYTAALGKLLTLDRNAGKAFGQLTSARDVSWLREDPWPFLLMPVNTARIIGDAIRHRSSFAEVAVRDVEWRAGEEDAA